MRCAACRDSRPDFYPMSGPNGHSKGHTAPLLREQKASRRRLLPNRSAMLSTPNEMPEFPKKDRPSAGKRFLIWHRNELQRISERAPFLSECAARQEVLPLGLVAPVNNRRGTSSTDPKPWHPLWQRCIPLKRKTCRAGQSPYRRQSIGRNTRPPASA